MLMPMLLALLSPPSLQWRSDAGPVAAALPRKGTAVAGAFCSKHDLPGEAAAPLAAAIEQQMELCKNV